MNLRHRFNPSADTRASTFRLAFACAALAAGLTSCTELEKWFGLDDDSDSSAFVPHTALYASLSGAPMMVRGKRLVYLANEAGSGALGTNFNSANGDLGQDDNVPILVDMSAGSSVTLRVAVTAIELLGSHAYFVVSESADSWDWSGDGTLLDVVLLHYPGSGGSPAAPKCEFVDLVDGGASLPFVVAGNRLVYSRPIAATLAAGETNLAWVDAAAPTTPTVVLHNIAAAAGQGVRPRMIREEEELVMLTLSEQFGFDLNNDGDGNDTSVLTLWDATDPAAVLLSTELALSAASSPMRALATGTSDWLVAFLVSEAGQANFATGLNDAIGLGFPGTWFPSNCPGLSDIDTSDNVLHFLEFAAWSADPVVNPPLNTGLAGTTRVYAVNGFVATLVNEASEGAGCFANADGDNLDVILRWTSTATPLAPFTDENELVAVAFANIGGGSGGAGVAGDRFVCVVDEAADGRNHDADLQVNSKLVAWLDPSDGAAARWTYDHDPKVGIQAAGATWMQETTALDRIAVGLQESVAGKSLNGADVDLADVVPSFARFDSSTPPRLRFPHAPIAVAPTNAGIVVEGAYAFYRGDEATDGRDWTHQNALNDDVLCFSNAASPGVTFISALNLLGLPSVTTDGKVGAALLVQESMAVRDLNGDGDTNDFVVRWFTFQ